MNYEEIILKRITELFNVGQLPQEEKVYFQKTGQGKVSRLPDNRKGKNATTKKAKSRQAESASNRFANAFSQA